MTRFITILNQYINVDLTPKRITEIEIGIMILGAFILSVIVVGLFNKARLRSMKKGVKKAIVDLVIMKEEYEKLREEKEKAVESFSNLKEDSRTIVEQYKLLQRDNDRIKAEMLSEKAKPFSMITKQKEEIKELKTKNEKLELLKQEYDALKGVYHSEKKAYQSEIMELKNTDQVLKSEIERHYRDMDRIHKENCSLIKEVEELKSEAKREIKPPPLPIKKIYKKDDLKQIRGIGPAIEKKLNNIGINTIEQISKMTLRDIKDVTEKIKFFPGRIERDNWVFQAREILRVTRRKMPD